MITVTIAHLRAIAAGKAPLASVLVGPINRHAAEHGIDTPLLMAHFLCHMAHETNGFSALVESLNYSAAGLRSTFGRHRITDAQCKALGRPVGVSKPLSQEQQAAIANVVYGGAWGKKNLGNTAPDDGWRYRGGGPYQLTGRANYRRFGKSAGVDLEANPEIARDPDTGVEVAARYFVARMKSFALRDDLPGATQALNGGALGLDERAAALARAKKAFGVASPGRRAGLMSTPDGDEEPVEEITDPKTVQLVQEMLRNIGYAEVGTPNGEIGPFTKTAILAFREENGLPTGTYIDDQLVAALVRSGPRKLPESRTNATPAEVREKAPEAKANFLSKVWAGIGGVVSAVLAIVNGVVEKLTDANDWLDPIKNLLSDVPTWAWALAGVGVAFVMYRIADRGEKAAIEAVKTGARR